MRPISVASKVKINVDVRYGNALVHFDRAAERKLRLKIDLMIVPTVSLLYLFCFIDRANIGMSSVFIEQDSCP